VRRVVILGGSGAGKSTLARKLGAALRVPVIHMDALFWNPGWQECETEEFRRRTIAAHAGDAWVSDGNYSTKTWDIRIPRSDAIIWFLPPRMQRVRRVLTRWLSNLGTVREDIGPGCPEKIDWPFIQFTWKYDHAVQPRHAEHLKSFNAGDRTIVLRSDREAEAFLARAAERAKEAA
jgi:adenylate kinase family enzyme